MPHWKVRKTIRNRTFNIGNMRIHYEIIGREGDGPHPNRPYRPRPGEKPPQQFNPPAQPWGVWIKEDTSEWTVLSFIGEVFRNAIMAGLILGFAMLCGGLACSIFTSLFF
jgi:hypothetical protein